MRESAEAGLSDVLVDRSVVNVGTVKVGNLVSLHLTSK